MNIPTDLKAQCSERAKLIADMMEKGSIPTPVEYLETPVLLIMHHDNDQLMVVYRKLMRTRKPTIPFGLNGRVFVLKRSLAVLIVKEEMKHRGLYEQRRLRKNNTSSK